MRRIYRYEVPVDDQAHMIALHGDPVAVECRRTEVVEFWAIAHENRPTVGRTFMVVGTGHPLPGNTVRHWGTAIAPGGHLVWHLVELAS